MSYYTLTSSTVAALLYYAEAAQADFSYTLAQQTDYGTCDKGLLDKLQELQAVYSYFQNLDLTDYDATVAQKMIDLFFSLTRYTYAELLDFYASPDATILNSNCTTCSVAQLVNELGGGYQFNAQGNYNPSVQIQKNETLQLIGLNDIYTYSDANFPDTIFIARNQGEVYGNYIISGGELTWVSGMTYNVGAASYIINNVLYYYDGLSSVTLTNGDATFDRFDAVVFDTAGNVQVITGTPALNPVYPFVDPTLYVTNQFILVGANQTTITTSSYTVYRENLGIAGSEWDGTPSNGAADLDGTITVYEGSKSITVTEDTSIVFVTTSPIDYDLWSFFRFRIYIGGVAKLDRITLSLTKSNNQPLAFLALLQGSYGLNFNNRNEWQYIVIPKADFALYGTTGNVGQLRMSVFCQAMVQNSKVFFDNLEFYYDAGIGVGPSDAVSLFSVSTHSVTTADSIYRLTPSIDVEFQSSDFTSILYLAEATRYVGINTDAPSATLDVVGTLQFVTGNQGAGKVLVSDASGNADWQSVSTGSYTFSNGLTATGSDVKLGGALTQNTLISDATSTYTHEVKIGTDPYASILVAPLGLTLEVNDGGSTINSAISLQTTTGLLLSSDHGGTQTASISLDGSSWGISSVNGSNFSQITGEHNTILTEVHSSGVTTYTDLIPTGFKIGKAANSQTIIPGAGTWSLTLPTSAGTNNYVLKTDGTGITSWVDVNTLVVGGSSTFTGLSDTPANYTGAANKFVRVNSAANALEFVAANDINLSSFNDDLTYDNYVSWTIAGDSGTEAVVSGMTLNIVGGTNTSTAYDAGTNTLTISATAGGVTTYLALSDTPASFTAQGGYFVRVNSGATALEHVAASSINISTFNNDAGYITANQSISLTGDVTGTGTTSIATTIANNAVTYAKFQDSSVGFTVLGKTATGSGDFAEIVAGEDSVLRRSGTGNLTFGTLVTNHIGDDQITNAKLANMSANTLKGRAGGTAGDPSDIIVGDNSLVGRTGGGALASITFSSINLSQFNDNLTYDNYVSWTISDGTNSESVTSGATLQFAGAGAATVAYNTTSNIMTITSTDTISNSFETITVTDTDSGFTWAETGSAVATIATDTLTLVSGPDIDIDVDATSQAIRIAFTNATGYITNITGQTLSDLSDVPAEPTGGSANYFLQWADTGDTFSWVDIASLGGGATTFTSLTDTPANYTAAANYFVRVNSTPNALEFVAPSSINLSSFNNDLTYDNYVSWSVDTDNEVALAITSGSTLLFSAGTDISVARTSSTITIGFTNATGYITDITGETLSDLSDVPAEPTGGSANYFLQWSDTGDTFSWVDISTLGGGGGVTATGTPVDSQIAVWTSASAIEGTADFTYDTASQLLTVGNNTGAAKVRISAVTGQSPTLELYRDAALEASLYSDGSTTYLKTEGTDGIAFTIGSTTHFTVNNTGTFGAANIYGAQFRRTTAAGGSLTVPHTFMGADNTSGIIARTTEKLTGFAANSKTAFTVIDAGTTTNAEFFGSADSYGSTTAGQGVIRINDVTTIPAGTLASGGLLYVSGTSLYFHADSGTITDLTAGGGGTPGGSDTQIQYNNGGAFGGMSTFTYNDATNLLTYQPVLDEATGDENAFTIEGTINKATSGNTTMLYINATDTLSPGFDYAIRAALDGNEYFSLREGTMILSTAVGTGGLTIGGSLNISGNISTATISGPTSITIINTVLSGIGTSIARTTTNRTSTDPIFEVQNGGSFAFTGSTGEQIFQRISGTVNQTSTASYAALVIDITETAVGSGGGKLLETNIGGSEIFSVLNTGALRIKEITAPTTNVTGYGQLYSNSADGKLYWRDDAGTVYDLTVSGGGLANIVEDTTPQLGGHLDLNQFSIELDPTPTANLTGNGITMQVTVDTNTVGIGAVLALGTDGNYDLADADSAATALGMVVALESGTGTKRVLTYGIVRNDAWAWSTGLPIYLGLTSGVMTQNIPTGSTDQVIIIGWALSADVVFFNPYMAIVEIA